MRIVGHPAVIQPQRGRLRDAVEGAGGYDPSGILIGAADATGGVEIEVTGAAADHPGTGVSWSVPLRGVLGRLLTAVPLARGRPPYLAAMAAIERVAWDVLNAPGNGVYWVGLANDRIAAATQVAAYMVENTAAGQQRVGYGRLAGGTWSTGFAPALHADASGAFGVPQGPGGGTADNSGYSSFAIYPYAHSTSNANFRMLLTSGLTLSPGDTPHLIFGAGHSLAGTQGTIRFDPVIAALNTADLDQLEA